MEIIKRWLKDKAGMEIQVQNVDAPFSNGYRLGQVLEAIKNLSWPNNLIGKMESRE